MVEAMPPLRFVAEPRVSYRARYMCEGRPSRNRAQRFVRADDNPERYVYPTIEIPREWTSKLRQPVYIRLTHVTCPNEKVNVRCVHPYPIATEDTSVIQDRASNSLFFPLSDDELATGRKSFQFTLYKLTQYQMRSYGPLRVLNSDERDYQRLDDPTDPRKMIDTYQLTHSQIICSIATLQNNQQSPVIYNVSSVFSKVMAAAQVQNNDDDISVRCSPQRGDAHGGDEILMVIPRVDKRRAFTVRFDHPSIDSRSTVNMVFVDTKTISFYSPPCPIILTQDNPSCTIPIVVTQNNNELARIDFMYQSMDYCLNCRSNKRSFSDISENEDFPFDDITVEPMNNQESDLMHLRSFLTVTRTNSSTNRLDQFETLENAINQGNLDLAWQIIRQARNFLEQGNHQGETPLLMAARLNQKRLIVSILNYGSELAKQKDQQGNNLLHLLANISSSQAKETIEQVLNLLDTRSKDRLISELNQSQERPVDVAKNHGHNEYIDLLNHQVNFFDIN